MRQEQRQNPISKRRLNKPWFNNGVHTEIDVNTNSFILVLDMKKIWDQTSKRERLKYFNGIPVCEALREKKSENQNTQKCSIRNLKQ